MTSYCIQISDSKDIVNYCINTLNHFPLHDGHVHTKSDERVYYEH